MASSDYNLDKFGTIGLFITAIFSPCCFPLFAFAATSFGLGGFELFGGWTMWVFQAFVLVSVIGLFLSYRKHKCMFPLLLAVPSAFLILYAYNSTTDYGSYFIYGGMIGLFLSTLWNLYRNRLHGSCKTCVQYGGKTVELQSTITCPECGFKKAEIMPTNACVFFYECENCHVRLRPLDGDCCVYCSYGTIKCPPIQAGTGCC